ncbi:hypothetical protein LTR85_006155 [Meristemomyces frigidus]|nr:hypothetical protein LTR85_006155 [Meristemomyces frigidus]
MLPISPQASSALTRLLNTVELFENILDYFSLRQLVGVKRVCRHFSAMVDGSLRMGSLRQNPYVAVRLRYIPRCLTRDGFACRPSTLEAKLTLQCDKPLTVRIGGSCFGRGFSGLTVRYPTLFQAEDGLPTCFFSTNPVFDSDHAAQWATLYPDMPVVIASPPDDALFLCLESERGQLFTVKVRTAMALTALDGVKHELLARWGTGDHWTSCRLDQPLPVVAQNEIQFTASQ